MLLAIDIGNTNITIGMFKDKELRATWRIATGIQALSQSIARLLSPEGSRTSKEVGCRIMQNL